MNHIQTPLNIVLAEDDIDDRFFFNKALEEIPISTHLTIVKDGEDLMNYLENNLNNLPDIVFLDLSMPKKTGFECLIEIKEDKRLKSIYVIVFTTSFGRSSSYEQSLIDTLLHIGAQKYIRKPSDIEQLKVIIHKALIDVMANKSLKIDE